VNKVSVVILNWNGLNYLKQFLPGVVKFSAIEGVEVVVADNGSSDSSVEFVETNFANVNVIRLGNNYGFAGGYNKALQNINSEYYVLLNSDVEVTENWLQPIIDFMDASPKVGACMPKMHGYGARGNFEYAGAAGGFIDKFGYPFCRGRIFDTIEKDTGQYDEICDIFWASGACMFVKAEAFWKTGGLDEKFFAHMEEIDLCWRLKWYGYEIKCLPNIVVYHVGGGSLPKENPRKTFLNFRNNLYMLYKNLPGNILLQVFLFRIFLDLIAALHYIVNFRLKHSWAIIRAHSNFYRNLSYLRSYRKSAIYLKQKDRNIPELVNKNVVFEYFIKGKKTYKAIIS
jgi:hypothetical protein